MRTDVNLLEFRVKEKDQELKLAELRIKELKKQLPYLRLKPMPAH